MFGLEENDWNNLKASVKTSARVRPLSPAAVGVFIKRATEKAALDTVAKELGFSGTETLRSLLAFTTLDAESKNLIGWGVQNDKLSFSAASELIGIEDSVIRKKAFVL